MRATSVRWTTSNACSGSVHGMGSLAPATGMRAASRAHDVAAPTRARVSSRAGRSAGSHARSKPERPACMAIWPRLTVSSGSPGSHPAFSRPRTRGLASSGSGLPAAACSPRTWVITATGSARPGLSPAGGGDGPGMDLLGQVGQERADHLGDVQCRGEHGAQHLVGDRRGGVLVTADHSGDGAGRFPVPGTQAGLVAADGEQFGVGMQVQHGGHGFPAGGWAAFPHRLSLLVAGMAAVVQVGVAVLLGDLGQAGDALSGQPVQPAGD